MTTDRLFELPDGSVLVIDVADASPAVTDQLETWSLVVDGEGEPLTVRDPSSWTDLISAGPLVVATVEGVIGNAAWSVFPAAARWLRGRRSRDPLDAAGAAKRAIAAISSVAAVVAADVQISETSSDAAGAWRVAAQLADGRRANVRLAATGACVSVRLH